MCIYVYVYACLYVYIYMHRRLSKHAMEHSDLAMFGAKIGPVCGTERAICITERADNVTEKRT